MLGGLIYIARLGGLSYVDGLIGPSSAELS